MELSIDEIGNREPLTIQYVWQKQAERVEAWLQSHLRKWPFLIERVTLVFPCNLCEEEKTSNLWNGRIPLTYIHSIHQLTLKQWQVVNPFTTLFKFLTIRLFSIANGNPSITLRTERPPEGRVRTAHLKTLQFHGQECWKRENRWLWRWQSGCKPFLDNQGNGSLEPH